MIAVILHWAVPALGLAQLNAALEKSPLEYSADDWDGQLGVANRAVAKGLGVHSLGCLSKSQDTCQLAGAAFAIIAPEAAIHLPLATAARPDIRKEPLVSVFSRLFNARAPPGQASA